MKHKKRKVALLIVAAVAVLGGISAFAYFNAEQLGVLLGMETGPKNSSATSISAEEPKEAPSDLQAYAEQFRYLKGKRYSKYISKTSEEYMFDTDISEVPVEALGYAIRDLDGDGAEELLVISLEAGYFLKATVYEENRGTVQQAAEYDLKEDEISINFFDSAKIAKAALLDCYFFGENQIGFELSDGGGLYADGIRSSFVTLTYDGEKLVRQGQVYYCGSSGEYDDTYIDALKELGIQNPSWNQLCYREKNVRDYVSNYEEICSVQGTNLLSNEEFQQWYESTANTPLKCMELYCSTDQEITDNTKAIQAAYKDPGDTSWKDAYTEYLKAEQKRFEESYSWDDVIFSLFDMNGDAIPELYIGYGSLATGSKICTYSGTEVKKMEAPYDSGLKYIKGGNRACLSSGRQGQYQDDVFAIENGDFAWLGGGAFTEGYGEDAEKTFTWEEKNVSESEYNQKLNELIDTEKAIYVLDDEENVFYGDGIYAAINDY